MLRSSLALLVPVLVSSVAGAQVQAQRGDVLIGRFTTQGDSYLQHLHDDGTPVQTCTGTNLSFVGAALTSSGRYATTVRTPDSVALFDASGALVSQFLTPEITGYPGDIDVFRDGTLAVVDQTHGIELYDESGVHQGSFTATGLHHPYGIYIDPNDVLWAADEDSVEALYAWNRQGTLLHAIPLSFFPGDLVVDLDGTLWVTDAEHQDVVHLDASGSVLGSFHTPGVLGSLTCIGLHPDGTLYVAAQSDTSVHHYTKQGVLLGTLPLPASGSPALLVVTGQGTSGTGFCYGDGAPTACPCANPGAAFAGCAHSGGVGAELTAFGLASFTGGELSFHARQLPSNQPVLLFSGANAVNGGLGAPFGDGLRCAGGDVVRLGVAIASPAGQAHWGPGLLAGHGWAPSDTRRFQAWYRDPVGSPCGAGFNLTNGVEHVLQP